MVSVAVCKFKASVFTPNFECEGNYRGRVTAGLRAAQRFETSCVASRCTSMHMNSCQATVRTVLTHDESS